MRMPKLLLILDDAPYSADLPSPLDRPPLLPHSHPHPPPPRQPLSVPTPNPNPPFDSSIPITIIVLLTALFFMAFFSLYLRCFSSPSPPHLPTHPSKSTRPHPHLLGSLPLVIYDVTCRQSDCVVCLTEFEEGETVKVIPLCRHVFHPECVDAWLSSHVSCPVCRSTRLS